MFGFLVLAALHLLPRLVLATPKTPANILTTAPSTGTGLDITLPSPLNGPDAPKPEAKRETGLLRGLLARQSCGAGNGRCPKGACCTLDGSCCNGGDYCCFRQNWCYGGGCCPRTQIGCAGSCCYGGTSCCEVTILEATDKRIKYTGSWSNAVSSCEASWAKSTKVTTALDTSISFSFNGTGVWLNAKQSTYTVVFNSFNNYFITALNVTGDCDIGWSREKLPYNEYRVNVFPRTESGPFELISFSVSELDKYAVKSTPTKTSTSATRTPTQSSSASSWINSDGMLDRIVGLFAAVMIGAAL